MPTPITSAVIGLGAGQQPAHELVGEVEAGGRRAVHLGLGPVIGDELSREVAERRADVLVAEVEADRERRPRREPDLERRPPCRPRALALRSRGLLEDARALELVEHGRDRRAREAGVVADLGAAASRTAKQRLDHTQAAQLALAGEVGHIVAVFGASSCRAPPGSNRTLTTLKHYAANNSEIDRRTTSSDMDDRTLREYYTAAFRRGVVVRTRIPARS